ncbi:MAG: SirB2 family protein [Mariprofundaceae bacterium]|nr:SirB2 family protein [Mariprofundaceae bacterium]
MQDLTWLLPLHIACVSMLFLLFLWRLWYVWQGHVIPYPWLKRGLPDVIDVGVLLSGVSLAVHFFITPWDDAWFAMKLLLVLLYIGMGFVCFSARFSLSTRRIGGVSAMGLLFVIVWLVVTKNISFV